MAQSLQSGQNEQTYRAPTNGGGGGGGGFPAYTQQSSEGGLTNGALSATNRRWNQMQQTTTPRANVSGAQAEALADQRLEQELQQALMLSSMHYETEEYVRRGVVGGCCAAVDCRGVMWMGLCNRRCISLRTDSTRMISYFIY